MSVIFFLIPLSIVIAACFLGAFIWAVRTGQYEDTLTPAMRVLLEESHVWPSHRPSSRADSLPKREETARHVESTPEP